MNPVVVLEVSKYNSDNIILLFYGDIQQIIMEEYLAVKGEKRMDGDDIEVMPSLKHEDTDKAEAIWLKWMLWGNRVGCHQKPERSFFYKGYQFPVCARCTGVLFASVAACVMFPIYPLGQGWCVGMCLVMFLDWFIQRIGVKESTNTRRLLTGLAGGYGVMTLQLYMYRAVVGWIVNVVISMAER